MRLQATADLSKFRGDIARATAAVRRGKTEVLDRAAQVTLQQKQKQIGNTYKRPIPRSNTGKPLWERKGNWSNGQAITRPNENTRVVETTGEAKKYEGSLANLNTGADGVNRTNKASENTVRIVEPQIKAIAENGLSNALKGI